MRNESVLASTVRTPAFIRLRSVAAEETTAAFKLAFWRIGLEILSLGYVGIKARQPDEWEGFATQLLGMEAVDRGGGGATFRMDDRRQRLIVDLAQDDDLAVMGWEVADAKALDRFAARLDSAGVPVVRGGRNLADRRTVADLVIFHDPAGNRLEAFHGAAVLNEPINPGRPISGFKTGPLGMGHVVLNVVDADAMLAFYTSVLGFRLTDFGLKPYKLYFFHVNSRHHSFAIVETGKASLHHIMVEMLSLDDVGQGYDLAQLQPENIAYTLGRHSNDYMTSFYVRSPSGFPVEYGWGARTIDPRTWESYQTYDGPSLWGHERQHLPETQRLALRQMRLNAASKGVRAPFDNCPEADAVVRQE